MTIPSNKPQLSTNYKVITVSNILILLTNLTLIGFDIIDFIFDRPPNYLGRELFTFLWNFGGIVSGLFFLFAFFLAIFLALTPHCPQEKRARLLTRLSIINLTVGSFAVFGGTNVDTKMSLIYVIIPVIICVAIHLSRAPANSDPRPAQTAQLIQPDLQTTIIQSPPQQSQAPITQQSIATQPSAPSSLAWFAYFIVGIELFFFFTLGTIDRMLGMLNMIIVAIVSLLLNSAIIAIIARPPSSPSHNRQFTTSSFIAVLLCLWPMFLIIGAIIIAIINMLLS